MIYYNMRSMFSLLLLTTTILTLCSCHSHVDHDGDDLASFKSRYSREANEIPPGGVIDDDGYMYHDHGHSHEHMGHGHNDHGHSHDHGGHGHSHHHEGHGHSHEHIGHGHNDHGHSHHHGGHGHSHDQGSHAHSHSHDHGHSHDSSHKHSPHSHDYDEYSDFAEKWRDPAPKGPPTFADMVALWLKAILSTALISVAPIFILITIPLNNAHEHRSLLKVLLSFASGGLLGDAFLHLIPHASSPHSPSDHDHSHAHTHSHSHDHSHGGGISVGLCVLIGIIAFLIVEKFVRHVKGGHGHSHNHSQSTQKIDEKCDAKESSLGDEDNDKPEEKAPTEENKESKTKEMSEDEDEPQRHSQDEGDVKESSNDADTGKGDTTEEVEPVNESDIKVSGYLNLAADFAHNFTDGLAIGASYLAGSNIGVITTLTIFLHEIPHEIGDFAILVQSGCSKKKAMLLQFSTALGAMLGTVCSLLAGGIGSAATAWILPFTAGGFIYIATVSVIPELLHDTRIGQSIKEIVAMVIGIYMMVLIAQYET